jgi:EAL domain-containing protein (putative c-di-GMP-specific phosphodiesterase class I)
MQNTFRLGSTPAARNQFDEFDELVVARRIGVAFQPIVDVHDGIVVGYEALARPPAGSSFPDAASLLREAYQRGRVGELDWACRAAVFAAALEHRVPPELPLFVNVEPAALSTPVPTDLIDLLAAATRQSRFVVEVTERSLADDPAALIEAVCRTRDVSIGVALDDVGADPASLALMPLIAPDVIKLDLSLVQAQPNPEVARIVNAVLAESERSGAVILAEGVESARHLAVARSMGATLGQGWLFGAAAALPDRLAVPARPLKLFSPADPGSDTPFAMASRLRTPMVSTKDLLAATSRHLENEILHSSGKAVLVSSFEAAANFGGATRRRYERLSRQTVLTAVLGQDMPPLAGRCVRGAPLDPDDPLCREWTVVVLGSQFAAALIARRISPALATGPDQFEAIITHNRDLVVSAAKSLLSRVPPLGPSA